MTTTTPAGANASFFPILRSSLGRALQWRLWLLFAIATLLCALVAALPAWNWLAEVLNHSVHADAIAAGEAPTLLLDALLSPDAPPDHWDVIEGQGSIFHPAYAGVSLGLLHGSQPDVIVVCHEPGRKTMLGHPRFDLPSITDTIWLNLKLGRRTNPAIRCGGVSLNTSKLTDAEAAALLDEQSTLLGLPVADPMRGGAAFDRLVDSCLRGTA